MTTYRLFPSTNGPSAASSFSGTYQAGVAFQVTQDDCWLDGIWWWCCNTGQQTSAVTVALWQNNAPGGSSKLVPGTSATSSTLTAGAWNFIALAAPVMLSKDVPYEAVVGYNSTTGFPFTAGTYASNGITNGPLSAYSDTGGSSPIPGGLQQGEFGTGSVNGGNAANNFPSSGSSGSANFWVDVQIDTTAPTGAVYQLWPSQPYPVNQANDTANNFTLGTEFTLSQACTLNAISFYSPAGVTQLPTECGIYSASSLTLVTGTHITSPSWSGAAGSGWVDQTYSGVTLPVGTYKVVVFNGAGSPAIWNATTGPNYWASPGPAPSGITTGPLSAPADSAGNHQSTYNLGTPIAYPTTNVGPYTYWVDVKVTPQGSPPPPGASTSRNIIHQGIAAYLGGTLNTNTKAYTGGPLSSKGLGAVRAGYPKRINEEDPFLGVAPGTMSGAFMSVFLGPGKEVKETWAGPPQQDGSGNIISGGWKLQTYHVVLDCYHVSHHLYGEDAQVDLNNLLEAIKEQIRYDRTLGGICMDAGMTDFGITDSQGQPGHDRERTACWFGIEFEVRVNIIA